MIEVPQYIKDDINKTGYEIISIHSHGNLYILKLKQVINMAWDAKDFDRFSWVIDNGGIHRIDEIENRDVEIELKIDGKECDPRKFFSLFWEQYEQQIKREATKIVKEQTSEKFREIQSKLQDYEQICDDWANDINWQAPNKFARS